MRLKNVMMAAMAMSALDQRTEHIYHANPGFGQDAYQLDVASPKTFRRTGGLNQRQIRKRRRQTPNGRYKK